MDNTMLTIKMDIIRRNFKQGNNIASLYSAYDNNGNQLTYDSRNDICTFNDNVVSKERFIELAKNVAGLEGLS